MATDLFDAIVIGGGHNGLVAAAYLARAGLRVCVLERREIVGGAVVTEDLSSECGDEWRGVGVHTGAYVCSLFHPQIIEDLELRKFGLDLYRRDPSSLALFPDGRHLIFYPDAERTRAELERFCPDEVDAYFAFMRDLERAAELVEPFLLAPPVGVEDLIASCSSREDAAWLERLFTRSAREILDERFRSEELKAVLSTDGVIGTNGGPSTPGTAYVMLHHYLGRVMGARGEWGYVRGGMGALTRALADAVQARGGEVRVNAAVERIMVESDHAVGVALADGTELRARCVLSNADAKRTFLQLVGESLLPANFVVDVKSLATNGISAKINLLLSESPRFECLNPQSSILDPQSPCLGTIHFVPSMDYLDVAFADARDGIPSRAPMVECTIQTMSDPSLAPAGRHVVSLFTQYYPYDLKSGLDHEREREAFADRVVDLLCEYASNVRRALVARHISTPRELEARFGLPGGHIFHGELRSPTIFAQRPARGWSNYRTPIAQLYLCGSSAHPGGCVSGLPGRNAALAVLEDRQRIIRRKPSAR